MGLFYEEHVLGTCIELGTYEFTDENIRSFSTRFAPVPFHMNEEAAVAGLFGSFAAVGFHTCSAWMVCFLKTSMRARDERAAAGYALPDIHSLAPGRACRRNHRLPPDTDCDA
jgi:acyl dehydratase